MDLDGEELDRRVAEILGKYDPTQAVPVSGEWIFLDFSSDTEGIEEMLHYLDPLGMGLNLTWCRPTREWLTWFLVKGKVHRTTGATIQEALARLVVAVAEAS